MVSTRIQLLGGFGVVVDGTALPADRWSRRQVATFVKLLALAPDRRLHREQVIDALWPGVPVPDAGPRLHKVAHYARRALDDDDAVLLRNETVALLPDRDVDLPRARAGGLGGAMFAINVPSPDEAWEAGSLSEMPYAGPVDHAEATAFTAGASCSISVGLRKTSTNSLSRYQEFTNVRYMSITRLTRRE